MVATLSLLIPLVATLGSVSSAPNQAKRAAVRCYPGQPCFPTAAELSAFNASVNGQLFAERPVGVVCFKNDPRFDAAACADVKANRRNDEWSSNHFGAWEQTNWETCGVAQNCYATLGNIVGANCSQGSVPDYSVHALNADHVQKYVKFATDHNLRIVIKNTGHDYKGRSSGKAGFALWTHLLQEKTHLPQFVPKGCSKDAIDAIRIGSGVQWAYAYKFADSVNRTLVGGDTGGVGAGGGWPQGGGHSLLTPKFGMGADHLVEVDIVTPDGNLQTVSECSNPDLFWALRGGGGGTWGAVTSVTYRTHPAIPVPTVLAVSTGLSLLGNQIERLVTKLAEMAPTLADNGFGAVFFIDSVSIVMVGVLPDDTLDHLKTLIKPFFDYANTLGLGISKGGLSGSIALPLYVDHPTFYDFFSETLNAGINEPVGIPALVSSRLIPRHYFESNPAGVGKAVRQAVVASDPPQGSQVQILVSTPVLYNGTGTTAVNPVWYKSLWHVLPYKTWNEGESKAATINYAKRVHDAGEILRQFAPDGGAYQNEADVYEPNHRDSFWGSNYDRLASIKSQVDPNSLFQVWQGIGWAGVNDDLYQCYRESQVANVDLQ